MSQFDGKSVVFLCSQSSTPVVINFFRRFIERCEEENKALEYELVLKKINERIEEIDNKNEKINDIISAERGVSLQLLGILGAFIALTSASVSLIVSPTQPETFVGVLHSVTACILLLVIMIYLVSQLGLKNKKWIPALILSSFIIAYLFLAPFIDKWADNCHTAKLKNPKSEIIMNGKEQHESVSGCEVSQDSSLVEKQKRQSIILTGTITSP